MKTVRAQLNEIYDLVRLEPPEIRVAVEQTLTILIGLLRAKRFAAAEIKISLTSVLERLFSAKK